MKYYEILVSVLILSSLMLCCTGTSTNSGSDGDFDYDYDQEIILPPDGDDKTDGDSQVVPDGDDDTTGEGDIEDDSDLSMCGVGDSEKTPVAKHSQKIYYGTDAPSLFDISAQQQKAIGALVSEGWYGTWMNFCTATLVSSNVVLTAAHCFERISSVNQFAFAIGEDAAYPDAVFEVESFSVNSGYNDQSWVPAAHDNAIVVLKKSVYDEVSDIKPIKMNSAALSTGLVGQKVQNVGYGSTEKDDDNSEKWWVTESVFSVSGGEFTVNGKGVGGVCFGDSGGPALYDFGDGLRIIGTVSWGDQSCTGIDHYADTANDYQWLASFIDDEYECGDVDEIGQCQGNTAIWCDNGVLNSRDCSEDNEVCGIDDDQYRCVDDACDGITYEGECGDNNVAIWCEGNSIKMRHCEPCNQTCGYVDDTFGYYCKD